MGTAKKGLLQKAGKALGTVGNVLSIFDAVAIVDKVSGHAAPLIDKAIDRHFDAKKDLITLQDLTHLSVEQAGEILEAIGLKPIPLLVKADKKYASQNTHEVLRMVPKSGKVRMGSIVKLYYIDEATLEASQALLADYNRQQRVLLDKMANGLETAKKAVLKTKDTSVSNPDKDKQD